MRKIYYLLLILLIARFSQAQPTRYGNEWIDYTPGHQYYKIKVISDGFYQIPFALLDSTIHNLSSINPASFVMYHNGTMVPIYVSDTGTTMTATGYIAFYGKKNIGDVDSVLYPQSGYQPTVWYSLFSDTSAYFLTTKAGGNNFHYTFIPNDIASIPSLTEDMYYWAISNKFFPAGGKFSGGTPFFTGTDYLYKSIYDDNEAWGSNWIAAPNPPSTFNLPTTSIYTAGPPANLYVDLFTRTYSIHEIITTFNSSPLQTFNFDNSNGGFAKHVINQPMPLSSLVATNVLGIQEVIDPGNSNLLMYAELLYPHKYDFGGANKQFWLMKQGSGERYFRVNNFATTSAPPLLYDITNGTIIRSTDAAGVLPKKFVLPASAGDRELFLRTDDPASMTVITKMDTLTFQDYTTTSAQGNYMVITNTILRHDSLNHDYVQDYTNYRDRNANPGVGAYDARLFDIDQIIDQFGYGVRKTPLAVRNFVEYAYDHWTKKPEYLFIIGKGRDYKESRETPGAYNQNMITPFGRYPSDMLLACRRGSNRPLLAVGRLAAQHTYDVSNYLNKVKTYELQQNTFGDPHQNKAEKLWMKQIMHFSGGTTTDEQSQFASYLSNFATIAQDTSWGANVFTVYKTSSQPVDNSEAATIRAHIDSGASLLTFFGHAAGQTFDFTVDDPTNWTNYGKYPIIYSNGCQSGDISSTNPTTSPPTLSFSELALLTPNKCAVAFTAASYLAVSSGLFNYGVYAYQAACQNAYDKPWGKALQLAAIATDSNFNSDDYSMMASQEITLHGDPALTLNQYAKPDYQVDQSSLYTTPAVIDASVDTFKVNVIVTNLGKAIKDSIQITVTRTFPNPNPQLPLITETYKWKVKATYYIDTFSIKLPAFFSHDSGFGQNTFTVFVESEQRIPELSETNNGAGLQFGQFIEADDIIPIYPYDYAIVPKQNIQLKASTVNPFAPIQNYRLQIDTSELFLHPLAATVVRQGGGVIRWTVPITFRDSAVYYWRVSRDSINDTLSYRWHNSSFVYIKNEYPGWNQSHYYQYGHDIYDDSIYLAKDRIFKYKPAVDDINVETGWMNAVGGPVPYTHGWSIHGFGQYDYRMGNCISGRGYAYPANNGGFTFAVIDTTTGYIWQSINQGNNYGQYGNIHCNGNGQNQPGFDFNLDGPTYPPTHMTPLNPAAKWSSVIMSFLDSIPSGSILLMYSVNEPDWANLDTLLMNKLIALGATGLKLLKYGTHPPAPYAFCVIKGKPATAQQAIGINYAQALIANFNIGVLHNRGNYQSPLIGPASQWGSFHWRWRPRELHSDDQQSVDIIGVQSNGNQTVLLNTQALDTTITFISPAQYPYIQLKMHTEDDTTHTPSQLYYWRVLYKTVPEAAMNPSEHFLLQRDTVGLGDSLNVEIALDNVTDLPMDSMRTLYTIKGISGSPSNGMIVKSDSLRAEQTQILKFKQLMRDPAYAGKDRLVIEANPLDALHQPEQYHFNNYAVIDFSTTSDKVNPLLDVTFDGRRILNNDLVSAKPNVLISMKDENKYLALNDTSLAQVYIRYPGQTIPALINYDNNILTFYPATGNIAKNNQARIEYKPTFTLDGTYDLLIRDKDRSGNFSSNTSNRYEGTQINGVYYDYKISFNVITKSMITNVLNYPNPFTTRTQFVFTLTGSEIPDYMKIQIMTITGKVVKEIQRAELGNIHIGVNRTDYYWDGRDEFGDKLANGVYFYRVITKIDDKSVDHMSSTQYGQFFNNTNIDKYFKNGFGKLVIMR